MIHLAYDGSLNGDWVSRYAIRMAVAQGTRALAVVHVDDATVSPSLLAAKQARLETECRRARVTLTWRDVPLRGGVHETLLDVLPAGDEHVVVCGTRVRPGQRGFLSGTISERLLRQRRLQVMAIRVVQPGLLGVPRRLLIPLSGHPRGVSSAWPFVRLLMNGAESAVVLRVMVVSGLWRAHVTLERETELRVEGWRYVRSVMAEMEASRGSEPYSLEGRVLVSDDWAREVLVTASQLKLRMIVLGASERTLPSRLLRGNPLERILRESSGDVAICRGV